MISGKDCTGKTGLGIPYVSAWCVVRLGVSSFSEITLTVYPLPAFSPDFNPIEKLWRNTKKAATHLKYFKTFEQLRASVQQAFQQYLEDATQVIRVMKKLRTTAGIA